ncbi:hypothetical protein E6C27_scaffold62G00010 [Cucumis melo var. makuwa]|uniref:DNA-directed RNA polymerase I subunit RPA1-like n=1 Tax=Cucumis melo var. makuwa TaxID=1194695 RepID=A0A5A7VF57_CUCMM|nr:hypothetical protein E6C27_scaffold62G00010 [Cucumis melo var. makuwa]
MLLYPIRVEYWNKLWSYLSSLEGIKELTFKFSGSAASLLEIAFFSLGKSTVDPLSMDSIEGHNQVSGKGFPTIGPRIEAENVVIHRGLHVTRPLVVVCVLSGVRSCLRIDPDAGCLVRGSHWSGHLSRSLVGEGRCLNLYYLTGKAYGGTCALRICASFGSTRLICASFGSTRLICAFYGTTRLLCRVRAQRGADRREAGRTHEGHMDASGFLIASADVFVRIFGFVILS